MKKLLIVALLMMSACSAMAQAISYEEFEEGVNNQNAELPMALSNVMELTSVSVNRQYYTIRLKVNTFGHGFANGFNEKEQRERAIKLVNAVGSDYMQLLADLNLALKVVVTTEKGEECTITLSVDELKEGLSKKTTPMEDVMNYISASKDTFPMDMYNGMVMQNILIEDGNVVMVVEMDESIYNISNMLNNSKIMKDSIVKALPHDEMGAYGATLFAKAGLGMAYRYVGSTTKQAINVVITPAEIKKILSL